ncbi:MAG: flagellin [Eubacteriales bacterium]|nr:flagellin [Eubacteriales bacterium]
MRINNNLMAMNTHRQLGLSNAAGAKSMSKLSSGYRINGAAADAAGLAISEKMRGQIRGLNQASRNAQDGISLIQTAEGALNETHSILQRMRELAVQGANDTNETVDRSAINEELKSLSAEITRIAETTQFNEKNLLNGDLATSVTNVGTGLVAAGIADINLQGADAGSYTITVANDTEITVSDGTDSVMVDVGSAPTGLETKQVNFGQFGISLTVNSELADVAADNTFDVNATGSVNLQIGANTTGEESLTISIDAMDAATLGVGSLNVDNNTNAKAAVDAVNTAINTVSTQRSELGAFQNRLEHTIKNLDTSSENLQASESRIRDVDMAKEMMEFTKNNILQQAAQAMLAQANQAPQGVLQLLR